MKVISQTEGNWKCGAAQVRLDDLIFIDERFGQVSDGLQKCRNVTRLEQCSSGVAESAINVSRDGGTEGSSVTATAITTGVYVYVQGTKV